MTRFLVLLLVAIIGGLVLAVGLKWLDLHVWRFFSTWLILATVIYLLAQSHKTREEE